MHYRIQLYASNQINLLIRLSIRKAKGNYCRSKNAMTRISPVVQYTLFIQTVENEWQGLLWDFYQALSI